MTSEKKREILPFGKRLEIYNRLKAVIIAKGEGEVAYPEGVNDASIAEELGVSPSNVSGLRLSEFGRLQKAPGAGAAAIAGQVQALVNKIDGIEGEVRKRLAAIEGSTDEAGKVLARAANLREEYAKLSGRVDTIERAIDEHIKNVRNAFAEEKASWQGLEHRLANLETVAKAVPSEKPGEGSVGGMSKPEGGDTPKAEKPASPPAPAQDEEGDGKSSPELRFDIKRVLKPGVPMNASRIARLVEKTNRDTLNALRDMSRRGTVKRNARGEYELA